MKYLEGNNEAAVLVPMEPVAALIHSHLCLLESVGES